MKWVEGRVQQELNWKLPDKKKDNICGNNISRIYLENLQKSQMNLS